MKQKILGLLVIATSFNSAWAGSVCMGETKSGKIVEVSIGTHGTVGAIGDATIKISDKNQSIEKSMSIPRKQIVEYFEGCRGKDCAQASIGLYGFADDQLNQSVSINYVGIDYFSATDMEGKTLLEILRNPKRKKQPDNTMRVWKGEAGANGESSFYSFTDVVCAMDHDV